MSDTLRQSFLRLFDRCPHSAVLSLKHDVASHEKDRGTALHRVLERTINYLILEEEPVVPAEVVKDTLLGVLAEGDLAVSAAQVDQLRVMCQHFADAFAVPPNVVAVEQPWELEIAGATVTGTVDLAWIDSSVLYIRDWKTSPHIPGQDELGGHDRGVRRGAKDFQLIVYALLAFYGRPPGAPFPLGGRMKWLDLAYVYPMYEGLPSRGIKVSALEVRDWLGWLEALVGRVKALDPRLPAQWPAVPGSQCDECPAPLHCPLLATERELAGTIASSAEAAGAAEQWYLTDRLQAARKKALKGYAKTSGMPVPIGSDLELDFQLTESRLVDWDALERGVAFTEAVKTRTSTRFDKRKKASVA